MKKKPNQFTQADRERAVRLVFEQRNDHPSMWATIESIAPMIGCVPQTLHDWVRKHEVEHGMRDGVTQAERDRLKALEREVKELRRANEILKLARVSSTGRRNICRKSSSRCIKPQRFSGPLIQL